MIEMSGQYNWWIVLLSLIIAVFASYSALDLAGRVAYSKGIRKWIWVVGGAGTMGIGIWSMHFIGMLAFSMAMPMTYNIPLVFLSIGAAFLGSLIALLAVGGKQLSIRRLIVGTIFMSGAIIAMHYIGMEAMEMVEITYNPWLLSLSALIAVVASFGALKLSFTLSRPKKIRHIILLKLGSASVMGMAIAGMHYVGLEAATFYMAQYHNPLVNGLDTSALSIVIAIGTLCI
jgi:diguanylate cyclase